MATAVSDTTMCQQKRKPKNRLATSQPSAKHAYSPSKKGKCRELESGAAHTHAAFPRRLEFASSNWKSLQEALKIGEKGDGKPSNRGRGMGNAAAQGEPVKNTEHQK